MPGRGNVPSCVRTDQSGLIELRFAVLRPANHCTDISAALAEASATPATTTTAILSSLSFADTRRSSLSLSLALSLGNVKFACVVYEEIIYVVISSKKECGVESTEVGFHCFRQRFQL